MYQWTALVHVGSLLAAERPPETLSSLWEMTILCFGPVPSPARSWHACDCQEPGNGVLHRAAEHQADLPHSAQQSQTNSIYVYVFTAWFEQELRNFGMIPLSRPH